MNFYRRKLLNAILYFVKKRGRKLTTITVLAKLLFYFDFEHFKETGYPAIGLRYYAFPWGPLPLDFWGEVKDGVVPPDFKGKLQITELQDEVDRSKHTLLFNTTANPDMDVFTPREQRILEQLAFIFKEASVKDIVTASHQRGTPWSKTVREKGEKALIDYLSAIDKDSAITTEEAQFSLEEFFGAVRNFHTGPIKDSIDDLSAEQADKTMDDLLHSLLYLNPVFNPA